MYESNCRNGRGVIIRIEYDLIGSGIDVDIRAVLRQGIQVATEVNRPRGIPAELDVAVADGNRG